MGKGDSTEKHSSKHEKHGHNDPDRKHKKRRKHDDNNDADRHRKHKHRKRDKDESRVKIVDDDGDDKLWVENDIDMDGERVRDSWFLNNILMFIHLEPDFSSGYPNSGESETNLHSWCRIIFSSSTSRH